MKKIICILLAVSMLTVYMPVMAATTTFSDVSNNSSYKNAIYTLADFGIILGDAGSDTFRPKANISREEFSVIMTRVLGLGALNVTVTDYPFPDVTPSTAADWSIKATKIAYDLGIIKGFEDGTFRPKENVTFEQAVKMIVCTLGYDATAIEQGGWPNGYIMVARGFGILNNAEAPQDQPASREIIAQLVANCLDVPLADTEAEEKRTLLSEKLKYTEGTGVVTGVEGKALKSNAAGIESDEVQIGYTTKYKVGETSAKDYFGKQIKYYYKNDDGKLILVSARLTNKNSEVTVPSTDIKNLYANKLEYYPDMDDTTKFETYEFESNVNAIYNGRYVSEITPELKPASGSIRLIDNNGNGAYDVVIIDSIRVYVVSSVDTGKKVLYNEYKENDPLDLNAATNQKSITITKANTEVDFSQIKKGDVLLISESGTSSGRQAINVEIVTNTVEGNVTSMNSSYGEVIIAGKTYEFSSAYEAYIQRKPAEAMGIGDKVVAYLDHDNKIIAASVTTIAATTKYGYLVDAGLHKNEEYVDLLIITPENQKLVLSGVDKVRFDGETTTNGEALLDKLDDWNNNVTNKDIAFANYDEYKAKYPVGDENKDNTINADDETLHEEKYDDIVAHKKYAQLIKYTTNSSNRVDNIYPMKTSGDPEKGLVLSRAYNETAAKYNSSGKVFTDTGVSLSTSTKVMIVPVDRFETDEYSVGTYSKLKNGTSYSFEAFNSSETNVPEIILVYGSDTTINLNDPTITFALVDSIKSTIKDGETITTLECKVDGNSKTYYCENASVLANYRKGDVLKLGFDAKGYIKEVACAFDEDNVPAEDSSYKYTSSNRENTTPDQAYKRHVTNEDGTNYYTTVYGTVYKSDKDRLIVTPWDVESLANKTAPKEYTVLLSTSTKFFVLDTTVPETNQNRLKEGSVEDVASYMGSKTGASSVFTYSRGGTTRFVLVVRR